MKKIIALILVIGALFWTCKNDDVLAPEIAVTSLSPTSGDEGVVVTITGQNFSHDEMDVIVRFNFIEAEVLEFSETMIKVIVPAGNPLGEAIVTVITNGHVASLPFTYISTKLEILSISPSAGRVGTVVTITGRNFSSEPNGNTVMFGNKQAKILSATSTEIRVEAPLNPIGDVPVVVIKGDKSVIGPTYSYGDYVYTITTLAGSGLAGLADGQGAAAQFYNPLGMAFDSKGDMILVDKYNHRIRKITPDGTVTTIAGGIKGFADGTGTDVQFNNPYCIVLDKADNAYITDMSNNRIRKMTPNGVVTTFAGTGEGGATDGPAATATFKYPLGIAFDKDSNLVISDYNNHLIRRYRKATGEVETLAGSTSGYSDGSALSAKFKNPAMLVVDDKNNIIVADRYNYRIRKIAPNGEVTTIAGSGANASVDGTGTSAQFSVPSGIAIDYLGNYLVTDYGTHKIRKVTPDGVVTTFAGSGVKGSNDNGGSLLDATFDNPYGIAVDKDNNIYITEWTGNKVRKITHD